MDRGISNATVQFASLHKNMAWWSTTLLIAFDSGTLITVAFDSGTLITDAACLLAVGHDVLDQDLPELFFTGWLDQ